MNIDFELSKKIKKVERRLGKENLFNSEYLILKKSCEGSGFGLLTYYINFIGEVEFAISNNMIPVIDMKNYKNSIHKEGEVGKVNTWEIFFEQPFGISVEDALASKKARYYWKDIPDHRPDDSLDFLYNDDLVNYYHRISQKYMRIKPEILKEFEGELLDKITNNRCVGVLARGTDYSEFKPYSNPIQPTVEQITVYIDKCMKEYDCQYVFVATEDASILDKLKNSYGDKLLYVDQKRFSNVNSYLYENESYVTTDPVQLSKKYLQSIYLLSKCYGIVAGRTSGTVGACVMADDYRFKHILTYGRYGIDDTVLNRISV